MMNKDKDFRVGDVVCDLRFGTGRVGIICNDYALSIGVYFKELDVWSWYSPSGHIIGCYNIAQLYHGTLDEVFGTLPEIKPKRKVKKWVNLYQTGDNGSFYTYDYEELAKAVADDRAIAVAVPIEVEE